MDTLKKQQAKAWRLAPDDAKWIAQDADGDWGWRSFKPKPGGVILKYWGQSGSSSQFGYLYSDEINGWNWRDTLQSREEWEAMNKQDEKWMPEVGQECEFVYVEDICMDIEGPISKWQTGDRLEIVAERGETFIVWNKTRGMGCSINDELLRPIQSEADKMRDQYIESLAKALCTGNEGSWMYYKKEAEFLVDSGWVKIAPDEHVVKPLTDEQREELKKLFFLEAISQDPDAFIDAVLRELGLLEEK